MILDVFGTKVGVYKFDKHDSFQGKEEFRNNVEWLLSRPEISEHRAAEQYGDALTTVGHWSNYPLLNVLDLENNELGKWLLEMVKVAAIDQALKNRNFNKYSFFRTWVNRITKNCHGAIHKHGDMGNMLAPDMVMIYYYDVPPDSSSLVFLDNQYVPINSNTKPYYEYPESVRYHLTPEPGMLVVHSPYIPHGVSTHGSDLPRTCFIFEPVFEKNVLVTTNRKL